MPRKPKTKESLSPEEEFRRKAVLDELKRRKREESFESFSPHPYQIEFLKDNRKRTIVAGGNRSGKTNIAIYKAICWLLGQDPLNIGIPLKETPVYGRVCGSGMEEQVEKVLVEYFRKYIPRRHLRGGDWNYSQRTHSLHCDNGSWVEFMSFDQDPEKGAGRDLDFAILDDVGCSKRFMEQTRARLVDRNGHLIRTLCPEEGITWEYEWWERAGNGDPEYSRYKFRTLENTALSPEGVAQLISDIGDDETQYRIRLEGDFLEIGGIIYPQLKREFHVKHGVEVGFVLEDHLWPTGIAIDPGVAKEHAVLWFAVGPGSHIHFYREYFVAGTIQDLCSDIKRLSGLDNLQFFFIDGHWDWDNRTAKSGDGTESLNIEREFVKNGIPVKKAPLDIRMWQGIDQVRARLKPQFNRIPLITFEPGLDRTWYELTHYSQVPPKKSDPTRHSPRIRKVDDDACDCVRIAVTSNPEFSGIANIAQFGSVVEFSEYGVGF